MARTKCDMEIRGGRIVQATRDYYPWGDNVGEPEWALQHRLERHLSWFSDSLDAVIVYAKCDVMESDGWDDASPSFAVLLPEIADTCSVVYIFNDEDGGSP